MLAALLGARDEAMAAALLRPANVGGVWRSAPISPRVARQLRREYEAWGLPWPMREGAPKPHPYDRWRKGHRADVQGAENRKRVEDKMLKMPAMVEEYRAKRRAAREPKKGKEVEHIYDTLFTKPSVVRTRIKKAAARLATGGGK